MISLSLGCRSATCPTRGRESAADRAAGAPPRAAAAPGGAPPARRAGGPQPVEGPVRGPALLVWLQEDEPQPEHARLACPAVDAGATLRAVERELPEPGQPVGG